jgi:hypothetical protein
VLDDAVLVRSIRYALIDLSLNGDVARHTIAVTPALCTPDEIDGIRGCELVRMSSTLNNTTALYFPFRNK